MPTSRFCVDSINLEAVWPQSQNFIFFSNVAQKPQRNVDCADVKSNRNSWIPASIDVTLVTLSLKYICASGDPWHYGCFWRLRSKNLFEASVPRSRKRWNFDFGTILLQDKRLTNRCFKGCAGSQPPKSLYYSNTNIVYKERKNYY